MQERRRFRRRNGECRKDGERIRKRFRLRKRDGSCLREDIKMDEKDLQTLLEIMNKYNIGPGRGLGRFFK